MSAETLIDRLDALWLEMNDALAEPPAAARILNALHDAAQALRTPPAPTEAVAWRFRTADRTFGQPGPWAYGGEPIEGATPGYYEIEPLYTHPPQPDALPGDLREKVRGAMKAWAQEDCSTGLKMMLTPKGFCDLETRILSLIQSERGGA